MTISRPETQVTSVQVFDCIRCGAGVAATAIVHGSAPVSEFACHSYRISKEYIVSLSTQLRSRN